MNSLHCTRRLAACVFTLFVSFAALAQQPPLLPPRVSSRPALELLDPPMKTDPSNKLGMPALGKGYPPPPPGTILKPGEMPIDLGTALRLAGIQNPELMLARELVTQAAAERMLAAAQALPNLNVGGSIDAHKGVLQQSNGNILEVNRSAATFGMGVNAIAAGTVNIPGLYYNLNVGTAWFGFLQSRQNEVRSVAASRTAENDILLRVALAYSELLRADSRRAIARENRENAAEVARLTQAYVAAGQGRKADADRAAVQLQREDLNMIQADQDTLTASVRHVPNPESRPLHPAQTGRRLGCSGPYRSRPNSPAAADNDCLASATRIGRTPSGDSTSTLRSVERPIASIFAESHSGL